LDRVGILEDRQVDSGSTAAAASALGAVCGERDALFVVTFVEVTKTVAAECVPLTLMC